MERVIDSPVIASVRCAIPRSCQIPRLSQFPALWSADSASSSSSARWPACPASGEPIDQGTVDVASVRIWLHGPVADP